MERDCSIDCSSPMSAYALSNTDISLPMSAGMNMPLWVISTNSPTVFSVTVLPPVFGPVIISVLKSRPSHMSIGRTVSLGMRGCRPCTMRM